MDIDFSAFADVPVIDGHMHFAHLEQMDNVLRIMDTVPMAWVNLVSTPNPTAINWNPALIDFKAHCPGRAYTCGGLDYSQILAPGGLASAPGALADQIATLKAIGFDGLKLIEGKPTARKRIPIPLDAPEYEGMWAALEEHDMPIIWHVADPEEFWDEKRCPDWARTRGWMYGDGTFPTKESLYAEADHVLARHPTLKVVFAHFYFLSPDLERAGRFLDAHPTVCFDLTPGIEMYNNLSVTPDASRAFFDQYQDRLVYGTDITSRGLQRGDAGMQRALATAWLVRSFLERDDVFTVPGERREWLAPGLDGFCALGLPRETASKIYHENFQRLFGAAPAPLDREKALDELERMAAIIDRQAGDERVDNLARRVADRLQQRTEG
jgi:hypothetical protein